MSPAVERRAFVPAPARQQHTDAPLLCAPLHDLFVRMDMETRIRSVAAQDGGEVRGTQRPVKDLQACLGADRVDAGVFLRVRRGRRCGSQRRQPTERQRRGTALTP